MTVYGTADCAPISLRTISSTLGPTDCGSRELYARLFMSVLLFHAKKRANPADGAGAIRPAGMNSLSRRHDHPHDSTAPASRDPLRLDGRDLIQWVLRSSDAKNTPALHRYFASHLVDRVPNPLGSQRQQQKAEQSNRGPHGIGEQSVVLPYREVGSRRIVEEGADRCRKLLSRAAGERRQREISGTSSNHYPSTASRQSPFDHDSGRIFGPNATHRGADPRPG